MPTSTTPADVSTASDSARRQGQVVLRDLVALRQVGIEVVLAVPAGHLRDRGANRQSRRQNVLDGALVDHRQRPGQAEADGTRQRVWCRAAHVGRTAAEHLGRSLQLDVDLDADYDLVVAWLEARPSAARCADGADEPSDPDQGFLQVFERRGERGANVALPRRSERRAGDGRDVLLEQQPLAELLRSSGRSIGWTGRRRTRPLAPASQGRCRSSRPRTSAAGGRTR